MRDIRGNGENVAENFKPEGFEEFGDGQGKYSGMGFPENDFFPNKDDIIDDSVMNATKRHLFLQKRPYVCEFEMFSFERKRSTS